MKSKYLAKETILTVQLKLSSAVVDILNDAKVWERSFRKFIIFWFLEKPKLYDSISRNYEIYLALQIW